MKPPRAITGKYVVEAVAKAFDILDVFQGAAELGLNEISLRVGLNKSRTFRLLCTMAECGYVARNEDGASYRLGPKMLACAPLEPRVPDVKETAEPFMLELNMKFNETVQLAAIENRHIVYRHIVEPSRPLIMSARVGSRRAAHQSSLGKAMLAFMMAGEDRAVVASVMADLPKREAQPLARDLEQIRRRGYAIEDEENEPGVGCIAAPIFNATGNPIAALGVSGPAHRILTHNKSIGEAILAASEAISRRLGFTGRLPQQEVETRAHSSAIAK